MDGNRKGASARAACHVRDEMRTFLRRTASLSLTRHKSPYDSTFLELWLLTNV